VSASRAFFLAAAALFLGTVLPPAPRPALGAVTPTIDAVFPRTGQVTSGGSVTITGTNFFHPMVVTFDGLPATNVVVANMSTTALTCTAPAHPAGPVDVVVAPASEPLNSATLPAAFTYLTSPPSYVWVPRGPGSAGGGPDVSIVDYVNRRETATLDLNALFAASPYAALPGFPALPTDDLWCVTQVLFDSTGDVAFLATAGKPGTANSGAVYVVGVPQAIGDESGAVLLAALPALDAPPAPPALPPPPVVGNPYQLALSAGGLTLFAADGGDWDGGQTSLAGVNGRVLKWDLAALLSEETPTTLPFPKSKAVGSLPLLSYARAPTYRWDSNSSFRGAILTYQGTYQSGSRTVRRKTIPVFSPADYIYVTNTFSNSIQAFRLPDLVDAGTASTSFASAGALATTSVHSPYEDHVLLVETFEPGAAPAVGRYYRYSLFSETGVAQDQLTVANPSVVNPVRFSNAPGTLLPGLRDLQRLHSRTAWPYPGAIAMVAVPDGVDGVASWDPVGGQARLSPTLPAGSPTSLAFNDVTKFFYACEGDGGWTVFKVPDPQPASADDCPNGTQEPTVEAPALEVVAAIDDAEGADSLRVVGTGTHLVGTGTSKLLVIEGRAAQVDVHKVTGAPVSLSLDPAGGPSYPQPGTGAGRNFLLGGGNSTMRITGPIDLDGMMKRIPFGLDTLADPPEFTGVGVSVASGNAVLELGNQYDFLAARGSLTIRVEPTSTGIFKPSTAAWEQVLRSVGGGGSLERPIYARLIEGPVPGPSSATSPTVCFRLAAQAVPVLTGPDDSADQDRESPPTFTFDANQAGTAWLVFSVDDGGVFREVARVRVGDVEPGAGSFPGLRRGQWRRIYARSLPIGTTGQREVYWNLLVKDVLGRTVPAASPQRLTIVP
jgi:hypothetical protein